MPQTIMILVPIHYYHDLFSHLILLNPLPFLLAVELNSKQKLLINVYIIKLVDKTLKIELHVPFD